MRILIIITCLASIAFAFGSLPLMPDKVAVHFDFNGRPNRLEPPIVSAISMSIFSGMMAAVFIGVSALVSMSATYMPQLINIPNRDDWLNEKNRPATIRRIRFSLEWIGLGTMVFILLLQWEIFQANLKDPPVLRNHLLYVTSVFVAYIIFDQLRLYLSFRRLPENSEPQEPQV